MWRLSAPPTTAAAARTAKNDHAHNRRFIRVSSSKPEHDGHCRAPEGQLLRPDARRLHTILAAFAAEAPHVPVDADAIGDESGHSPADVDDRQIAADRREHTDRHVRNVHAHEPDSGSGVGPQRVSRQALRDRDDDVAGHGGHAAVADQVSAGEETGDEGQIGLDAEHLADRDRCRTVEKMLVRRNRLVLADEGRRAAERKADERPQLPFGGCRRRNDQQEADNQQPEATRWAGLHYRANKPRNTRANGDTVTSPAVSAKGFTRPSLFATMMSVMPFDGMLTSMEDEAFSLTPNCQIIGFPL